MPHSQATFSHQMLREQHPCTQIWLTHNHIPSSSPTSHTPIYPLEDEDVGGFSLQWLTTEGMNEQIMSVMRQGWLTRKKIPMKNILFCHPFHVETDNNSNNTHTQQHTLSAIIFRGWDFSLFYLSAVLFDNDSVTSRSTTEENCERGRERVSPKEEIIVDALDKKPSNHEMSKCFKHDVMEMMIIITNDSK